MRTFENYVIKAIEHFFGVYIHVDSSKLSGAGRILESFAMDYFSALHKCLESSQPSSCLDEAMQIRISALLLN